MHCSSANLQISRFLLGPFSNPRGNTGQPRVADGPLNSKPWVASFCSVAYSTPKRRSPFKGTTKNGHPTWWPKNTFWSFPHFDGSIRIQLRATWSLCGLVPPSLALSHPLEQTEGTLFSLVCFRGTDFFPEEKRVLERLRQLLGDLFGLHQRLRRDGGRGEGVGQEAHQVSGEPPRGCGFLVVWCVVSRGFPGVSNKARVFWWFVYVVFRGFPNKTHLTANQCIGLAQQKHR